MKNVIHKAVRPKSDYANPILCQLKMEEEYAHKRSRVSWERVTCKKCLAKKI